MEKELKMTKKKIIMATCKHGLLFLSVLLIACASTPRTVAQDDRISLRDGGPHAGTWESSNVSLDYRYSKQPGAIQLSVSPRAKRQFSELTVWALFVDAKGNVIGKQEVYSIGTRPGSPTLENKFEIPSGTAYLSFNSHLVSSALTPRNMYHPPMSR
jgi:hypothetical protein